MSLSYIYITQSRDSTAGVALIREEEIAAGYKGNSYSTDGPASGDFEAWPYRYFVNTATDLLKYVYYFAAMKNLAISRDEATAGIYPGSELNYAIILPQRDRSILDIYPDIFKMEGAKFYEHKPASNAAAN